MKHLEARVLVPPASITDAQAVRQKVFQEEQGIAKDIDFDGQDESAIHVVIYDTRNPVGTGRIRYLDDNQTAKIERVAVLSELRGLGIGRLIMRHIDSHLATTGASKAVLDAQLHAKGFYESLGYKQEGEIFEEVGIPHVKMVKNFK